MISIFIIHLAKYDLVMYGEQKNDQKKRNDQISCINVLLDDLSNNKYCLGVILNSNCQKFLFQRKQPSYLQ